MRVFTAADGSELNEKDLRVVLAHATMCACPQNHVPDIERVRKVLESRCGVRKVLESRCGECLPQDVLYRHWPHVVCSLEIGHRGKHRHDRPDGVSFEWSCP
jgi:hypothetical protein